MKKHTDITLRALRRLTFRLLAVVALLLTAVGAYAFPTTTYRENSRLSEGRWVKVAVTRTGLHAIPAATLRQWGFSDPKSVAIYGYGGARISDFLDLSTYIDDLPRVQNAVTDNGTVVFYAQGPYQWLFDDANRTFKYHENPFATEGYYFLTDGGPDPAREIPTEGTPKAGDGVTRFTQPLHHEVNQVSPGQTGHLLVGEDFKFTNKRTFSFQTPGRVADTDVKVRVGMFTCVPNSQPTLTIALNGKALQQAKLTQSRFNEFGDTTLVERTATPGAYQGDLRLELGFASSTLTQMANLDYITLCYERSLDMKGVSNLEFTLGSSTTKISNAAGAKVWDVTDPLNIVALATNEQGGSVSWHTNFSGWRTYAAWTGTSGMPVPTLAEQSVASQNLHGEEVPDMVIVTPGAWRQQAERLANVHRNSADSLKVLVVSPEQIYNEFSSGTQDVNSIRRCLKMFYDRGNANPQGRKLKYALLMARPSYDNRQITDWMKTAGWPLIPSWQSDNGSDDTYSYSTDDVMAYLEDGAGSNGGTLSIAIGRLPIREAEEAKVYVDKIAAYVNKQPAGDWKNKIVVLADDQDNGIHLEQAERAIEEMEATQAGLEVMKNKVYCDAYEKIGGVTQGARDRMYRGLEEGAGWWWYIGHASIDNWTNEGMLNRHDIENNTYFRRVPMLYAATCTFSRWDGSLTSGAELLASNPSGGTITSICPTRPVYISSNGVLSRQMGQTLFQRDENGRPLTVGEIFRRAKNLGAGDTNRMRYVLLGDPALRSPLPANRVIMTKINNRDIDPENPPVLEGRKQSVVEGYVADWQGNKLSDFNGQLTLSVFDAEESVTTLGRGTDEDPGKESVFDRQGMRLFAGCDSIRNGEFKITVAMPSEIAWNYRPAAALMYARENTASRPREAVGQSRDFYVYGLDEASNPDTDAPTIEALYINHPDFASGDVVNESPMAFAQVADNIGINLSQAGIGHTLWMSLDGSDTFTDVSDYYTPNPDGTPGGTVAYPFENLENGNHTLEFRVWDTSDNFATASVDFFVQPGLAPKILDVRCWPSPASTEANFYITHNRPDAPMTVTVAVYDLAGREIWRQSQTGRSDMFLSAPLTWNLTDSGGNRVARGIYVYRAEVTTDGQHYASEGRRLAVTAR